MASISESVRPFLSDLRRHASALTGDRRTGDWYVRITLETLLQEPFRVRTQDDVRFQLYKLFGSALAVGGIASRNNQDAAESDDVLKQNLLALPFLTRHLFLLVTLGRTRRGAPRHDSRRGGISSRQSTEAGARYARDADRYGR
jgi:hypothetical protein